MIQTPLERSLWNTKVSQAFGVRNPHYRSGIHNGVDHAVPVGTPIYAPAEGTEVYQTFKNHKTLGNACYLRFTHNSQQYWMRVLHLREVPQKGVYKLGSAIAYSGASGDSTGPHTHTELWKVAIDTRTLYTKSGVINNLLDPVAWFNSRIDI